MIFSPGVLVCRIDSEVACYLGIIYGFVGTTVRGVFIIDPNQTVRWMIYYPAETGRNIREIIDH